MRADRSLAVGAAGRALRFAERVERTLRANGAGRYRRSQQQISASLGALDHHVALLGKALERFIQSPSRQTHTFEHRLLDLVAQMEAVRRFSSELIRPMKGMVRARCGTPGVIEAFARAAATWVEGIFPPESAC